MTRLQHIDDVASLLPLYLEGDALALYMEMKGISLIEDGTFTAYRKLTMVRWAGECVDVYANKISSWLDWLGSKELDLRGSRSWLSSQVSLMPFQVSCSKLRISKPWPWETY